MIKRRGRGGVSGLNVRPTTPKGAKDTSPGTGRPAGILLKMRLLLVTLILVKWSVWLGSKVQEGQRWEKQLFYLLGVKARHRPSLAQAQVFKLGGELCVSKWKGIKGAMQSEEARIRQLEIKKLQLLTTRSSQPWTSQSRPSQRSWTPPWPGRLGRLPVNDLASKTLVV